jgi:hypothetical protein
VWWRSVVVEWGGGLWWWRGVVEEYGDGLWWWSEAEEGAHA